MQFRPLRRVTVQFILTALLIEAKPLVAQTASATDRNPAVARASCEAALAAGRYLEALQTCQTVLQAAEKQLGPDHEDIAAWLRVMGRVQLELGKYAQAEPLILRSLKISEAALGPEHPHVAASLHNLAAMHKSRGQHAQAEPLFLRSLKIFEAALGPEHPDVATCIDSLAGLYYSQYKYVQAEPLFLRSLKIREKALGPEHRDIASSFLNLAVLYYKQSKYTQAELLFLRGLDILNNADGPEHPKVAAYLSQMAELYQIQGKYVQAEPLLLRSLAIQEKALGPEHPEVASDINNLARLGVAQGQYARAEQLLLRGLAIQEKALGPEHPDVAITLNNLADLYRAQSQYARAEPLFLRSLTIGEKTLGSEHPDVAPRQNNLGLLYYAQGQYAQAEPLFLRSLTITEKTLGPEHPQVSIILNNLALLYGAQGQYAQAELLFLRSLTIWEKALGPEHPEVARRSNHIARLDLVRGKIAAALTRFTRGLEIQERTLRATATEARITAWLDLMRGDEDAVYSLPLGDLGSQDLVAAARSLALRVSLLRKGRAQEAGLMTGWAIAASLSSSQQRQLFARWQEGRGQREQLFLRGPSGQDEATRMAYQAMLTALQNEVDDMEHELALAAPQLASWKPPLPEHVVAKVAARLAPGDALVEVLWVRPRQFRATAAESRWAAPRYVALILFPNQRIEFVDLGDAEKMDRAVTELLVAVRNTRQEPLVPAQALYKKVMVPLLPKLGSVQRIFLSPDGSLNLVPFAALHDGKQYLVESPVQIHYLGSGRDLLREVTQRSEQSALVLADPDTGAQLPNVRKTESRAPDPDPRGLYDGLAGLASLPGARMEGTMIGGLLHVSPLLGLAATEAALRETRSPFILHIATHGLFSSTATQDSRGVRSKMVGVLPSDRFQDFAGTTGSRSLSTSALVLAGANHAKTASDPKNDGLLTAEEARSLHLFGTQLVVLSACDTGRGSVQAGQGVYGLRRSFLAAGAEAVVMSLWPVSDSGTQTLMKQYYQRLLNPQDPRPRITALREAMLEMKKDHPHPYYWAPFIAIGRDEPLRTLGPIQRLSASTP